MSSRTQFGVLVVSSVVAVYAVVGGVLGIVSAQDGPYPQLAMFEEVIDRIRDDYVDEPDMLEAMEGAFRGMVQEIDPNGGFLSPDSVAFYREYDPLATPGIGVIVGRRFDFPVIVTAIPGSPADAEGLGTGDAIESVDGMSLREFNIVEVQQALSGETGTTVELNVIRRSTATPETITMTRRPVALPALETRVLDGGVAYLKIPFVGTGAAADVRLAVEDMLSRGALSLIVDLRGSAGGAADEAVALASLFVESGTLGYVEGQTVERETFTASAGAAFPDLPLALLISEGTTGAAEIAAGAIGGNARAQLLGFRTFGLASVQRLLPVEQGWSLLVAVARYYTPNDGDIWSEGVRPTVDPETLPDPAEGGDPPLDRAIEMLAAVPAE